MPITLYTAATPNGYKVSVALEEMGLPYEVRAIDLAKGEQQTPEFSPSAPMAGCRRWSTTASRSSNRGRSCFISPKRPGC